MAQSFADILKVSKKGLSGTLQSGLLPVYGRIPGAFSTGSLYFDYVMNGGWVPGQLQHFFGPSGGGKSTFGYNSIAANQRYSPTLGKQGMGSLVNFLPNIAEDVIFRPVIVCDTEGGLTPSFIQGCGVDLDNPAFTVFYPENGEDWFHFHKRVCLAWLNEFKDEKTGVISDQYAAPLTMVDSLATLISSAVLEDEKAQMAQLARLLSFNLPVSVQVTQRAKAMYMMVNHVKINPMAGPYGNPETTSGGSAPHFLCSDDCRISRTGKNEEVANPEGGELETHYNFKLAPKKCRHANVTGKTFDTEFIMGHGFERNADMWNFGLASGQIKQMGAWYQLDIIGRPDLNTTKNYRQDDIKQILVENNLWEVFVKQVFTGAAWKTGILDTAALEILGAVKTNDVPSAISPSEEAELQRAVNELRETMPADEAAAMVAPEVHKTKGKFGKAKTAPAAQGELL
jgi:recombination protein RecA